MRWPAEYHPLDEQGAPEDRTVLVWPLEPGGEEELAAWAGGQTMLVNGAAAVLLPGDEGSLVGRIVGLGDAAVRDGEATVAVPGSGLGARFVAVDADVAPEAGEAPKPDDDGQELGPENPLAF